MAGRNEVAIRAPCLNKLEGTLTKGEWLKEAAVQVRMATYRLESSRQAIFDARRAAGYAGMEAQERALDRMSDQTWAFHQDLEAIEKSLTKEPEEVTP